MMTMRTGGIIFILFVMMVVALPETNEAFTLSPLLFQKTRRIQQQRQRERVPQPQEQQQRYLRLPEHKMTIATRRPPGPLLLSAVSSDDKNKNNNKKSHNTDVSPSSRQDSFSLENSTPKWPERVFLGLWITALSSLILVNNFVGPWPQAFLWQVPERTWLVTHLLGGMLFGGAIVLTTFIEALVVWSGDKGVQKFWYDKVSWLNAGTVVPGLTAAMVSGVGLSVHHYGGLAEAPKHVIATLHTLTTFGLWWAVTDLTTQGKAQEQTSRSSVEEDRNRTDIMTSNNTNPIPLVFQLRQFSNVISCMFVVALYVIMVMKTF